MSKLHRHYYSYLALEFIVDGVANILHNKGPAQKKLRCITPDGELERWGLSFRRNEEER